MSGTSIYLSSELMQQGKWNAGFTLDLSFDFWIIRFFAQLKRLPSSIQVPDSDSLENLPARYEISIGSWGTPKHDRISKHSRTLKKFPYERKKKSSASQVLTNGTKAVNVRMETEYDGLPLVHLTAFKTLFPDASHVFHICHSMDFLRMEFSFGYPRSCCDRENYIRILH